MSGAANAGAARRPVGLGLLLAVAVALALFGGTGGRLAAVLIAAGVLGSPLFVLIGLATVLSFAWFAGQHTLTDFLPLIERIRSLADNPTLLAIPLFIMSGAVMSRGQISARLIGFARELVGWVPGGLAMSAVVACMLFAAISGSSPATVVAIGAMMGPTLLAAGYPERFAHGLLTSAGSLGILIPPSIPMIVYPIVNQRSFIEVEQLFASGIGPGLVIGGILMGFSFVQGLRSGAERHPFSWRALGASVKEGFWALSFPVLVLGGIYGGFFNAVEAAAVSVVYALAVEVWIHGALRWRDVPGVVAETGIFLGSLLVIMVAALALGEFFETQDIPRMLVEWLEGLHLSSWQFLLALNLLLLVVGMAMDILSAMFVFVPLLAPVAQAVGVDPMHFGILFIVNLEIGYLTPPVGLNLFVASTLFERSLGHVVRSVLPFILLMLLGLGLVTYVPALSVGLGRWLMGVEAPPAAAAPAASPGAPPVGAPQPGADSGDEGAAGAPAPGKVQSLEEMMRQLEMDDGGLEEPADEPPEAGDQAPAPGKVQSIEEMMREVGIE